MRIKKEVIYLLLIVLVVVGLFFVDQNKNVGDKDLLKAPSGAWSVVGNLNTGVMEDGWLSVNPEDDMPVVLYSAANHDAVALKWDGNNWQQLGNSATNGNSFYHPLTFGYAPGSSILTPFTFVRSYAYAYWTSALGYPTPNDGELTYFDNNLGNWVYSTIPASQSSLGGGDTHETSIDINTNNINSPFYNVPIVAFREQSSGDFLVVKEYDVISGTYNNLLNPGVYTTNVDARTLKIADNGDIYVAFISSGFINVIKRDVGTGNWNYIGNQNFVVGNSLEMEFDKNGIPCIAYIGASNRAYVDCFDLSTNIWNSIGGTYAADNAKVSLQDSWRYGIDLKFDSQNRGIVGYVGSSGSVFPEETYVSKYDGLNWNIVGSEGFSPGEAYGMTLDIDSQDNIYVAFEDQTNGESLMVMMYGSGTPNAPTGLNAGIN